MALSGTINGSVTQKSSYFSFYLTWSATQNVAGNYSDVTVKTYWKTNNTYQTFDTVGSRNASITINGTTASISKVFSVYWSSNPYLIQTATQRVYHNNDGTKSITISARANGHAASYGPSSSTASSADCTASGTITLNTIPRASSLSLSATSVNVGNSITATITRASTSFTHKVEFYINNTYRQEYENIATSKSFTIPTSWYAAMPSSTNCTAYCRITTYNGNTQIGNQVTKSFTVNVPSSVAPTVGTITFDPVNIATLDGVSRNFLIQGKNKLTISVSGCSAGTGSGIKSYTFSGPGVSSTITSTSSSASVTSGGTISNTGTLTYTVKVTDNRGRTASKTATYTCYAYQAPYFRSFSAYRSDSKGTANDSGTYVRCNYNFSYSSIGSTNNATVKIYYKKNSVSGWSVAPASIYTGTSGNYILSFIDLSSTYTVYATITDNYGGSTSSLQVTIFGTEKILNVRSNGKGIAFGKMASADNVLDSRWPIKSDNPAATMNNLTFRGANLISSTTNDTTANWVSQGNLATTYYNASGQLNGQPGTYGFVVNFTNNAQQVHQLWMTQREGNMCHRGGNVSNGLGSWRTVLDSTNYTSWVTTKPTSLYSSSSGTTGTITLSQSAANFTYLEIFYADNNSRQPNSIKIYSPNGKYVSLSCVEPSTSSSEPRVYIRASGWTISGTSMTVGRTDLNGLNRGVYGQIYPHANGTNIDAKVTENNYIKIFRILGYK